MRVNQLLAGFAPGDAISNEALLMRRVLREAGCCSNIYCDARFRHPDFAHEAADFVSLVPASSDDLVILHLSIGSVVNEYFRELPCRKLIVYHNMTPAAFFSAFDPQLEKLLELGRRQAAMLCGTIELALADSTYNAAELTAMGYGRVKVLPLMIDYSSMEIPPCKETLQAFDDAIVTVLFVGRGAPNKRIEDCLLVYEAFLSRHSASRFVHVGSYGDNNAYRGTVEELVRRQGLPNVHLAGHVTQSSLNAFYRAADVFLCMSEHEGYCAPLVESMAFDVPVIARAASAVPETLGGAGICVESRDSAAIAESLYSVVFDEDFRNRILTGQRTRIEEIRGRDLSSEFLSHVFSLCT